MLRLGDAAVAAFQPIARGIDATFGTDLQHCGGCKDRPFFSQRALNRLSDELFELFCLRARYNDKSPMDYMVSKVVTVQYVVTDAKDDEDAIEKAQKGEGQRIQGGQNWQAVLRQGPTGPGFGFAPGAARGSQGPVIGKA